MSYGEETEWMRGQYKPLRIGLFKRQIPTGNIWWSYWNGAYWGLSAQNPQVAERLRFERSLHQELPWYGLARNPE